MRMLLAAAATLLALGPAMAKPGPVECPRLTPSPADLAIVVGAAGALIESDYFRGPPVRDGGHGVLACRLQSELFSKLRLAQACH